jgi:hypothetical protein
MGADVTDMKLFMIEQADHLDAVLSDGKRRVDDACRGCRCLRWAVAVPVANFPLFVACGSAVKFPGVLLPPSFTYENVVELFVKEGGARTGEIAHPSFLEHMCMPDDKTG